jgi:hypothetical protein
MQIGGGALRPRGAISRTAMTKGAVKKPSGSLKMKASSKLSPTTGPKSGGPQNGSAYGNPGGGY